jgi:hypothetical protein
MTIQRPSEKSFGIVFSIVFFLISVYPLLTGESIYLWAAYVSATFLILAYSMPKLLVLPNKLWFKFGIMLSTFISPIIMGIVYFSTVVPIGLIMKIIGKDSLHRKLDKGTKSYWIERREPIRSMINQF